MKKCTAMLAVLTLSIVLFVGCGKTYEATESTVFVQKDGTILSTDIESFDPGTYDENGLSDYVDEAILAYTSEHGADSVKLKDLSFADGEASLSIEYASVKDYSDFNGIEMFTGSIAEALAAGYSFDGEFYEFENGKQSLCDASAFLNTDGYKVVIIKSNTNVHVNGKVKYASVANVSLLDNSTVSISADNSFSAEEESEAEDTEPQTESTEEATEESSEAGSGETESADEGSISDDDFVLDEEEDTEVIFEFEEQERPKNNNSDLSGSYTNVYTYIIYK